VIRIGIIGAGEPARLHLAAFEAAGADLIRTGDEELLGSIDAAVVASEPDRRFHHTALALEHGLDVLVEQPVAPTVDNARMLERIASLRPSAPVVQVSQPDHFNPVFKRLSELLDGARPVAIDFRRRQAGGGNAMLADLHTLVGLARSPLVRLQASGGEQHTVATLVFESGLIGTLATSSAGPSPAHEVLVTTADALIAVDAVSGSVDHTRDGVCERTHTPVGDALAAQAESFLRAVRERARPAVGLRAAAASQEVLTAVRECLAVQSAATGTGGVPAA
jgi:predicted dehydrogenase